MKRLLTILLILFTMATTISAQSLTSRQKHLATIAALEAQGDLVRLEPAITEALNGGVTINEIKEALSQLYAYTGFPRSLNALGVLSNILSTPRPERKGQGEGPVWSDGKPWVRPAMWDDAQKALAIGTEVQTKLSGRPFNYEFCPQNDYYLKAHLFGDIFAGDQLTPADREIVTVAALSALKGVAPQLAAHKAGAVNMGNTQEQVDELCQFLSDKGLSQCDAAADACAGSWPKGNPNDAYAQYFTGQSYLAPIAPKNLTDPRPERFLSPDSGGTEGGWLGEGPTSVLPISNVTFEPGCRVANICYIIC